MFSERRISTTSAPSFMEVAEIAPGLIQGQV